MKAIIALVLTASAAAACTNTENVDLYQSAEGAYIGGYDSLDLVLVVDNSISMGQEQAILSTSIFTLVNSLVSPLPGWDYPAADDIRVALVTSDMGLSWGGVPYSEGDGWPGTNPCTASGDNGQFQSYGLSMTIDLANDHILCGYTAEQCPTGWTCSATEPGEIGTCHDPAGTGENLLCPELDNYWAQTTTADPQPDLAFQVACLARQGTAGCGFEQQLQAAATSMVRSDQQSFFREEALLGILVVSDEEDCSMQDGPGLFATDEIQGTGDGPSELNIACGRNQEYLYSPTHFHNVFRTAKGGREESVVFAAITGVPTELVCEGSGDLITGCLAHGDMQLKQVLLENSAGQNAYYFRAACERYEGALMVTSATPGRRYVELAQEFHDNGYIYSICNGDWGPAMGKLARLIAQNLGGTCFPQDLPWDTNSKTSTCDLYVEYDQDLDTCPADYFGENVDPIVDAVGQGEDARTISLCKVSKLAAELDCGQVDPEGFVDEIGWYYCVNLTTENFPEACDDDLDNDQDSQSDCDDEECSDCGVCGGMGDTCQDLCKFNPQLTVPAENAFRGKTMWAYCPAG